VFDLSSLRLLYQNGCFVTYPFFVFRSCSCFCYLLIMKLCGLYIMWCKEKGFPLFLFMDLVLLHFKS